MKDIAMLALIVLLMLFASCTTTSQQAVEKPPQPVPASPVKMREAIPRLGPNMGAKRDLGTYIRQGSQLLAKGNQEAARLELERGLYHYPNHDILTTLFKQIDADPKALFGDPFTSYTIQPGDTLSTIAQDKLGNSLLFYGLAKYNDIEKPQAVNVGQHIKIPTSFKPPKPVESTPRTAETPPMPTPSATQGLPAQEAPVELEQAPKEPVRVAETTPRPMPAPKPEPPQEPSAIKEPSVTSPDQLPPRIALTQPASLYNAKAMETHEAYLQVSGIVIDDSDVRTFLINDAPIDLDAQGYFSHRIDLPAGPTVLELVAIDTYDHKTTSTYTITRRVMSQIEFGQYHALVIGNNDYIYAPKLQAAVSDAKAVSELLKKNYAFNVKILLNATREQVMGSLYDLRGRLTEQDNLLIYYAGHGVRDEKSQEGYWLAIDAHQDNPANWISINDITTVLRSMASKHVMVVADSCFSGTLTRALEPKLPNAPEKRELYLTKMLQKRSRTALTSGGLEPVPDRRPGSDHSVFAYAFMTALQENPDILEGQKLFDNVRRLVVVDAPNTPEYANIRFTGHEGSDFFFVRKP